MSEDDKQHSRNWLTHKNITVFALARAPTGEIALEDAYCNDCGQRTPYLDCLSCEEWQIKTLLE